MSNKMLIDAVHLEEIRVALLRGSRVEDFDFESANKKPLRGNIYLAKVTRVEPSLQAAFVDYGGNRHGFLAFSEIHPDYYQIPVADRQELLRQEMEEAEPLDADAEDVEATDEATSDEDENVEASSSSDDDDASSEEASEAQADDADDVATIAADAATEQVAEEIDSESESGDDDGDEAETNAETVSAGDAMEEVPQRRTRRPRPYKIQEVIKRRQILLVQVVKEERGNKGAALTTYMSLAGRYSVLMPNTARGGGISRKISSAADRKRLKEVAASLNVPEGMGVILRTAGANRTKAEVRRDFEYLLRLWENVRTLTLESHAPTLVYEEGDLIKRAIRDLYSKEISEVTVAGEDGYKEAKDFMRMLMPSHAKNVKLYKEATPLFAAHQIETQLEGLFVPEVTLKSGGYIVVNQTEALVAIDVNSGRSTKEHSIEDTALKTNLEAAEEIARQLRLRDLAGLIVIDFIDMEERRNNRAVEKKLKDCLKNDRARIQVGRISSFGLLEMSRQRLRSSVLEGSTNVCPECAGTGVVRSVQSVALQILRVIEDAALKSDGGVVTVECATSAALYLLNNKRPHIAQIEEEHGVTVFVQGSDTCQGIDTQVHIERPGQAPEPVVTATADHGEAVTEDDESEGGRKRRRRRRRKSNNDAERAETSAEASDENAEDADAEKVEASDTADGDEQPRRRRRGRRGGRRNRKSQEAVEAQDSDGTAEASDDAEADDATQVTETKSDDESGEDRKPRRRRRRRSNSKAENEEGASSAAEASDDGSNAKDESGDTKKTVIPISTSETADEPGEAAKTESGNGASAPSANTEKPNGKAVLSADDSHEEAEIPSVSDAEVSAPPKPKRKGWWQRAFSSD
ncbi:MAG: Rne/Rng family ribonuclease [Pseudomonadota bacterium]